MVRIISLAGVSIFSNADDLAMLQGVRQDEEQAGMLVPTALDMADMPSETSNLLHIDVMPDLNGTAQLLQSSVQSKNKQMESSRRAYDNLLTHQQDLLQKMIEGQSVSAEALANNADLTRAFDDALSELIDQVKIQKGMIDEKNADVDTCNAKFHKTQSTLLRPKETNLESLKVDHKSCRAGEVKTKAAKVESCAARDKFLSIARTPPACLCKMEDITAEKVRACIREEREWSESIPDLDVQEEHCTGLETELADLSTQCNEKQIVLERDTCAYTEELNMACVEEADCVGDAVVRRDHMYTTVQHLVSHLQHTYLTMQKIKCIVSKVHQLQDKKVNASAVNVTECLHEEHDIPEEFVLDKLELAVERVNCDEQSALIRRPGSPEWVSHEFADLDPASLVETKACEPLPASSTASVMYGDSFTNIGTASGISGEGCLTADGKVLNSYHADGIRGADACRDFCIETRNCIGYSPVSSRCWLYGDSIEQPPGGSWSPRRPGSWWGQQYTGGTGELAMTNGGNTGRTCWARNKGEWADSFTDIGRADGIGGEGCLTAEGKVLNNFVSDGMRDYKWCIDGCLGAPGCTGYSTAGPSNGHRCFIYGENIQKSTAEYGNWGYLTGGDFGARYAGGTGLIVKTNGGTGLINGGVRTCWVRNKGTKIR